MKNIYAVALAAIFGLGSTAALIVHQAQNPASSEGGLLSASSLYALADRDHHNNGNGNTSSNGKGNGNGNGRARDDRTNNPRNSGDRTSRDRDDRNGNNNGGYNNGGYNNGSYNNGSYNNGGYNNGRNSSNASVSGRIVGVSGNRLTILQNYTTTVTINDQAALDRQSSGRVYVGRYVTAYGYWQGGIFYATSIS